MRFRERPEADGLSFPQLVEGVRGAAHILRQTVASGSNRTEAARSYYRALEMMTARALVISNQTNGFAQIPADICLMLSGQFSYLAVGRIPEPMLDCAGRGVKEPAWAERHDIMTAVAYMMAARGNLLDPPDKAPNKTIRDAFKVHDRTVRDWCCRLPVDDPGEFCGGNFAALRRQMEVAGARYCDAGRSKSAVHKRIRGVEPGA